MNYFTIILIFMALTVNYFKITEKWSYFIAQINIINVLLVTIYLVVSQIVLFLTGLGIGHLITPMFKQNTFLISFVLLILLSSKMIYYSIKGDKVKQIINPLNNVALVGLSIGAGINTLIIGLFFSFFEIKYYSVILAMSVITFIFTLLGVFLGRKSKRLISIKLEFLGGVILLGVGLKILIDHFLLNLS
ncbi:MAG: manganese efflux pump [Bacteroidales bacterium]|nr:manganese efflux pump [Bacteroidales bacterium]